MKCISIFKCNPHIEVIDKSHCSLEDVPNFQNYSRSLEELFLDANKLINLNDNVFRLTRLRRLTLSDNGIKDIPPDIARLVNLVELDCSRNQIETIPEQIKFLRGLQICDFSANKIEYLPSGLVQLKNLTCLTLNHCFIRDLPDDFSLLKNLEALELRENNFEDLPPSVTALESLKKLDIGNNYLEQLPDEIGRLVKLEYLLADGNKLETIPNKIGRLENLQCLDLARQEAKSLQYLPEEISGLISLTDLDLSENSLQTLPDGIGNLRNLTLFKADHNHLGDLTPNIGGCKSLQELVLTKNQITKLPSSIGKLTDLRSLNVEENFISELPHQIGELKRLGILSLRDNLLTHLPNEIGQLEFVKVMDISGNKLEYLPITMTALNLKALWLSKNQAQPLPRLQIDELQGSGTKVLTCYLLPQQIEDDDAFDRSNSAPNDNEQQYDQQHRPPAVSFDTAAIDDAELSNDAQFVRHDTPHPHQLKARHQKLFDNSQTATITTKPELKGHVNASFTMADNNKYDYDSREPIHNIQERYEMDYESNGLPEVANVSNSKSQYTSAQTSSTYNREPNSNNNSNNYNHNLHMNHPILDEYNYQEKIRPTSYQNGMEQFTKTKTSSSTALKSSQQHLPHPECQELEILVRRSKNHKPGLGLSIAGGKDTPPYLRNDEGIFVSRVTRGGPAEAADVRSADKILAVNNNIFYEGITHQKAVDIFKRVKPDCAEFTMRVMRFPKWYIEQEGLDEEEAIPAKPDNIVTTTESRITREDSSNSNSDKVYTFSRTYKIPVASEQTSNTNGAIGKTAANNLKQFLSKEQEKVKATSSTLPPGLSLIGGASSKNIIYTTLIKDYKHQLGLVLENRPDEDMRDRSNIFIADIKPNSLAAKDGKLQVDDKLLTVNSNDATKIDLEEVMMILEGDDRFIRIVVSRDDSEDPLSKALKNMPKRPQLGSWFSSASNMSHRPSLAESYQGPKFGSSSSLNRQNSLLMGTKPPKPPKPSHLQAENLVGSGSPDSIQHLDENPTARPRGFIRSTGSEFNQADNTSDLSDAEKRAAWRRDRLRSIEDDVEMAKLIAEAQRRRREEK